MNKKKKSDLKFGDECEKIFLSKFKNIKKRSNNKMDEIDFINKKNNKKLYELKGRQYNFTDQKDWMVGMNKLIHHQKNNIDGSFIVYMLFYDGLYYWKYNDKDVLKKYCSWETRNDRGKLEKHYYFNIKRELFKKSKHNIYAPKNMELIQNIDECLIK